MSCVIKTCKSHPECKEPLVSFHKFPKNESLKNIWIQKVNRNDWSCSKFSSICSKHFAPDAFIPLNLNQEVMNQRRRLRPNAVPTMNLDTTPQLIPRIQIQRLEVINNTEVLRTGDIEMDTEIIDSPHESVKEEPPQPIEFCEVENNTKVLHNGDVVLDTKISKPSHESMKEVHPTSMATNISNLSHESMKEVLPSSKDTRKFEFCNMQALYRFITNGLDSTNATIESERQAKVEASKYEAKIRYLERELERVQEVSKRRFKKVNALTKQLRRLEKKNVFLFNRLSTVLTTAESQDLLINDSASVNEGSITDDQESIIIVVEEEEETNTLNLK